MCNVLNQSRVFSVAFRFRVCKFTRMYASLFFFIIIQNYIYNLPRLWICLPLNVVKSRSHDETGCYDNSIALQFDRHLGSDTAEVPVKLQSDRLWDLAISCGKTSVRSVNWGPVSMDCIEVYQPISNRRSGERFMAAYIYELFNVRAL